MRRFFVICLLLQLACAAVVSAREWNLPFRQVDGYLLVQARLGGHEEPLTLLVDSGASVGVISLACAERLGLPLGEQHSVRGVNAEAVASTVGPLPIRAGGRQLGLIEYAVDLSHAALLCRERIDGLVGVDFFADRAVSIDFARQQFRISSKAVPSAANQARLPMQWINGVLCVGVKVNGSQLRWARLDTGCNDALHWVVPAQDPRLPRQGETIGFITEESEMVPSQLQLAGWTLPNVPTSLHARPLFPGESGLLGNGVLRQYRVTVDALRGELVLER